MRSNTSGGSNVAVGYYSLLDNVSGDSNVAIGEGALLHSTGRENIAIGRNAGSNLDAGDFNIYIGSASNGAATESDTIRIGDSFHTRAFLAGVNGVTVTGGTAVYVASNGQLGTVVSSRRYKQDIADVGDASDALLKLRPVSFRYTPDRDPSGEQQYGLIAEDVAEVAPDLVIYGKDGQPETVKYHLVNALLLDQVQKQQDRIEKLEAALRSLEERLDVSHE